LPGWLIRQVVELEPTWLLAKANPTRLADCFEKTIVNQPGG